MARDMDSMVSVHRMVLSPRRAHCENSRATLIICLSPTRECGHRDLLDRLSPDHRSLSSHKQDAQDKRRDAHWSRSQVSSQAMQITTLYNNHQEVRQVSRSASPQSKRNHILHSVELSAGVSIETEKIRCVLPSPQKTSSLSSPLSCSTALEK